MKQILDDLKTIPGFIGAYCFDLHAGIPASNLPPIFKEEKLIGLGRMLVKVHHTARGHFPELIETSLYYQESLLLMREVNAALFLVLFAEPSVNANLLSMSLNLAVEELKSAHRPVSPPAAPATAASAVAPPSLEAAESLLAAGPLAEPLQAMQALLAKVIGPMARIIFLEAVAEWVGRCRPEAATIPELLKLLEKEIGEREKIAHYRNLLRPHLPPARL